jgi:hypothetical protein
MPDLLLIIDKLCIVTDSHPFNSAVQRIASAVGVGGVDCAAVVKEPHLDHLHCVSCLGH